MQEVNLMGSMRKQKPVQVDEQVHRNTQDDNEKCKENEECRVMPQPLKYGLLELLHHN